MLPFIAGMNFYYYKLSSHPSIGNYSKRTDSLFYEARFFTTSIWAIALEIVLLVLLPIHIEGIVDEEISIIIVSLSTL